MPTLPFPLIGPTYTNRSLPVSSQVTRNFYVEVNQQGNEPVSFMPFPGLKPFATTGSGVSRGLGELDGILYAVTGTTLYKITSSGSSTAVGTVLGDGRCNFEEDGTNLIIATGDTKPYAYDGATLAVGSDADLADSSTVAYINRRVVYDGNNADVIFADLDQPLSVDSANVISADTRPDDTLAIQTHRQQVYVYGSETIQPMYNSGTGNPPYNFILNSVQEIGLGAVHSIASNKIFRYFLGSDRQVYRGSGLDIQSISNPAIGQAIENYSTVGDAYGVCFAFDSQDFYLLSFPTGNETWLFNEQAGLWTNLAYGTDGAQHLIYDYRYVYGKHLVSDRRNGNIYELDFDTYTDNGDVIQRQRDTISINGGAFGQEGARVFMDKLELIIETGTSLVTSESKIIMQYSDDNGRSWSTERWLPIGQQGEYRHKLWWFGLGEFYNRQFRFRMSDPIKWVLISASADVELGGN